MSKTRKEMFAAAPWITEDKAKSLHEELSTRFTSLKDLHTMSPDYMTIFPEKKQLPFNGNEEHDGNLILAQYLHNTSPEKQAEQQQKMANRANTKRKSSMRFRQLFGVNLNDYWDGVLLGFDIVRFDSRIVKSGNGCMLDVIKNKWGDEAAQLVDNLAK
jgi:hypothetical protein